MPSSNIENPNVPGESVTVPRDNASVLQGFVKLVEPLQAGSPRWPSTAQEVMKAFTRTDSNAAQIDPLHQALLAPYHFKDGFHHAFDAILKPDQMANKAALARLFRDVLELADNLKPSNVVGVRGNDFDIKEIPDFDQKSEALRAGVQSILSPERVDELFNSASSSRDRGEKALAMLTTALCATGTVRWPSEDAYLAVIQAGKKTPSRPYQSEHASDMEKREWMTDVVNPIIGRPSER